MSEASGAAEGAFRAALDALGDGVEGDEVLVIVTRGGESEAFAAVGGRDVVDAMGVLRLLLAHAARVSGEVAGGRFGADVGSGQG